MTMPARVTSATSRSQGGAFGRSRTTRGTPSHCRSPRGACSRSRSPVRATSRSRSPRGSSPRGASSRSRSPVRATSRSRSPRGSSSRSRSPRGASSRSRSLEGHSRRSRSPRGASSRSRSLEGHLEKESVSPGASSRSPSPRGSTSRSPSPWGASSRRPSPRGSTSRSPSPRGSTSRSPSHRGVLSRSPSPRGASSRSPSPWGSTSQSPSPRGVSSRSPSPRGASSRSPSPFGSTSQSPSPRGVSSRSPSPRGVLSWSPSPRGILSRSPSSQGVSSRSTSPPKMSRKRNDETLSPSITENITGASATSLDPGALSSHEPPDGLYGVKVSNFAIWLKNMHIKSFLTKRFIRYGNVFSVTVCGSDRSRYVLVFYTQKHEQENALAADTTGPHGIKFSVTIWSGPSPSIFGIMITNIDGNDLDLRRRITSEFGIFGDITFVQISGSLQQQIALVFYRYQKGQEKALASPKPFKTSFGKVTVTAWNEPPPPTGDMSIYDISSLQRPSSRSPSPHGPTSRSGTCSKISNMSNSRLSPLVPVNQNNENVAGASTTPTGAYVVQPSTLSSCDPRSLYGVKLSNFELNMKSISIKSLLTYRFKRYGNVFSVTVHGSNQSRYALVFYKQKHEQEKALMADTKIFHKNDLSITPWSGPPPCTFGIMVTNIRRSFLDQIIDELALFGDVTLVQLLRKTRQIYALVFYKEQKGQEKALSRKNRFRASFGNVTLYAWNQLPPESKWRTLKLGARHGKTRKPDPSVSENRRLSHLSASTRTRTRCSRSSSSVSENRRRPHLSASTRIRTRRSRSRSPCSSLSENRRRPHLSASTRIRTRHSRSRSPCSSVSTNLSSRTRTRYSRCQSLHSNLPWSQSHTKRYSRSRSPCSFQLSSEHWHMEKRVPAQSRSLRDHRRVGLGDLTSRQKSLILWINNLEETISSAELHAAFKPFGEIEHIEIKEGFRNNGKQAFLQYNSLSSVTRAIRQMDGTFLLDRKLQVDFA